MKTVITGIGLVTPLGNTTATTWEALLAGRSGIGSITRFDAADYPSSIAGEVKDFDTATTGLDLKDVKKCDRFIHLGLAAMREAVTQAGLLEEGGKLSPQQALRTAVILGTGIGGIGSIEEAAHTIATRGPRRLSPFFIPAMLPNLLAGQASMMIGAKGANVCPVSACATSAHALGWAKQMIERGEADIVIAGGAEAAITPTSVGGFAAMKALSTGFNDNPEGASRPFDSARDGFVIAEGAAVLVLESEAHAKARGATIFATLAGFGQTADAAYLTRPAEGGEGAARAMQAALDDAGLTAAQIGYVNAHATSTPAGDTEELNALTTVFGSHTPAVSATKSATGHLLGAAGALEAAFCTLALQHQILPPTLNLETPPENTPFNLVPHKPQKPGTPLKAALTNSFGFGGTNAALVLTKN
ncbi:MAG: beta-ketoacyl-[acyl-carrier-protein] synthase II [Alphaproteobacteria bacterium CG_4_10_14_0_8_um_filter_53_9]|nr:MAG: beta-ketoacyl-[acyl-carrier-protein] synthase II [Alphaproteobacteria bacterium CG_4_10_14_0_8_um_filter_53_9]